jgi:DNA polymerase-3 subunit chi
MPRISFYFNAPSTPDLLRKLAAKSWEAGLSTLIYTADAEQAARIDRDLWIQPQLAFIPHARCGSAVACETPILIGEVADALPRFDLLINAGNTPPPCIDRFARLIEMVSTDEADRNRGRALYKHYRAQGYEIENFDLAKPA